MEKVFRSFAWGDLRRGDRDHRQRSACRTTVTAKDSQGRSGEFKPFEVAASQLTIIE